MTTPNPLEPPIYMRALGEYLGEIGARIVTLGHAMGSADYAMAINPRDNTYAGASFDRLMEEVNDMLTAAISMRTRLERLKTAHHAPDGNGSNGSNDEPEGAA